MKRIQLEHGIQGLERKHISQVVSGLKCNCFCPCCGATLIARKGEVNEDHFAHHNSEDCTYGTETVLHLMAKDILSTVESFELPAFYYGDYEIFPQTTLEIDSVRVEKKLGSIKPDLIITAKGKELIVEIAVTHFIDEEKLEKIRELNIATIEIDLSSCDRMPKESELRSILVQSVSNKKWIHNSKAEERIKPIREEELRQELAWIREYEKKEEWKKKIKDYHNQLRERKAVIDFHYTDDGFLIKQVVPEYLWYWMKKNITATETRSYKGRDYTTYYYNRDAIKSALIQKYRVCVDGIEYHNIRDVYRAFRK